MKEYHVKLNTDSPSFKRLFPPYNFSILSNTIKFELVLRTRQKSDRRNIWEDYCKLGKEKKKEPKP